MSNIEPTRESYLAEADRLQAERLKLKAEITSAKRDAAQKGRFANRDWLEQREAKILKLLTREQELRRKGSELPKAYDRTIGRKYRFLCEAIKRELGEEALRGLLLDAENLLSVEDAMQAFERGQTQ